MPTPSGGLNQACNHVGVSGGFANAVVKLAEHLGKREWKAMTIEGHTDSMGPEVYNLDLSQRRAAMVRKILVDKFKLNGDKISTTGFGENQPIANNNSYQGRQKNRRVEAKIEY